MRILAFGTYDKDAHPRVRVLLDGLRAHGFDVDECNARLELSTAQRVAMLRQPWRLPGFVARVFTRWARLVRRARDTPVPDIVIVGYLGHFDVLLARRLFRGVPVVLDHLVSGAETASDRRIGGGVARRALRGVDRLALAAADVVVVDTEEHRELVPAVRRAEVVVASVGADRAWFDAGSAAAQGRQKTLAGPLRVVFFGLYTPLQGAPVIGAALRLLADDPVDVTMIGHGQDLEVTVAAAGANRRVTWRRWVEATHLPALVASHDVCLGIFGDGAKSLRVVPTKVFQGLAAGCVVVTSDTPPQRRLLGSAAILVPPADPVALAEALRGLAADRRRLDSTREVSAAAAEEIASAPAVTADLAAALATRVTPARHRAG